MESISVRQRVRPVRYAYVVDSSEGFLSAAALNTTLWGGIYNPIISADADLLGYVRIFDPEYLVNTTDRDLDPAVAGKFRFSLLQKTDLIHDLKRGDRRRRRIAVGLGIERIIRVISESEFREPKALSRAALPVEIPDQWTLYAAAVFGAYAPLPPGTGDFESMYRSLLRSTDVIIDPAGEAGDFDVSRRLFPIDMTRYGIRHIGRGFFGYSTHVVYVGDATKLEDILGFWNIRATGRNAWFVPISHYRAHRAMIAETINHGRYPINPSVDNHPDVQKAPSVAQDVFEEILSFIKDLDSRMLLVRMEMPRFDSKTVVIGSEIDTMDLEAASGDEISIFDDGHMTPVKLIDPPGLTVDETDHEWAVELRLSNPYRSPDWICQLPNAPGIEKLFYRAMIGGHGDGSHLGKNGYVITENRLASSVYPSCASTFDVFTAILKQEIGLDVERSAPGLYAEHIIRRMGSLDFGCRLFKIRGVRAIVDRLSRGETLTKGNMHVIATSKTADEFGENWREDLYKDLFISPNQKALNFSAIFDELLAKRVVRPGLHLTCASCYKKDWYHVSEFAEEYTCRYCFERQRVPFGGRAEWSYRADGMFQIDKSAQGSLAAIVALWRFGHIGSAISTTRYITGVNLCAGQKAELEIDFCCLHLDPFATGYELVLGEAKNFIEYGQADVARLLTLADKFERKPFLAFATLKDAFTESEKEILRDAVTRGYAIVPLTRLELDPYDLRERFEGTQFDHVYDLTQLADACVNVNLR